MIDSMVKNINKVYKKATPYHKALGMTWYRRARGECEELSDKYKVEVWKVAAIVAALSPRNKWDRNLLDAETMLKKGLEGTYSTFGSNVRKAYKILNCNNIREALIILNGDKTKRFFINIYNKRSNKVTVDVWALRVAKLKDKKGNIKNTVTKKQYESVEKAYQIAAKKNNLRPYELQAITWGILREAI